MSEQQPVEPAHDDVPAQTPGAVPPVPSPGDVPGGSLPDVSTTGTPPGEGEDPATSPGWTVAHAVPGSPDGEVDTRA